MHDSLPSIIIFSIVLEQLVSIIRENCLLDPDLPVLAGVSGGPDSLCMLDILHQLSYQVIVAHLDHGLRAESAQEAVRLHQIAEGYGLPYILEQGDVRAYAASHSLSIEEAAREVRYRFLFEQAARYQAQAVAVGHTANDQVETVLMHLLRGSGLPGLRGMSYRSLPNPWSQNIPLVRPLLGAWREDILAHLEQNGLQPNLDASNLDTHFYRNRLRHELVPQLEKLNPGVQNRLWQMADILSEDEHVLEIVEQAAWAGCIIKTGPGYVALDVKILRRQALGLQRRLLRRAIGLLHPGLRDIEFKTIERAIHFLNSVSRSGQTDLAAGLRLEQEGERLWLATWEADLPGMGWPQVKPGVQLRLAVPGEILLSGGWQLQAERLTANPELFEQAQSNTHTYQAWLDQDKLVLPLLVRSRQPGERFQPLGMAVHSLKLSDFMINSHVPRRARNDWPLVISGEGIVWVPGYRIGESCAVKESTRQLARLSLQRIDSLSQ
jgi:tRNA(Ile)-lysidine synthase